MARFSFLISESSNIRYTEEETRKIDEETEQISLGLNEPFAYNTRVEKEKRKEKGKMPLEREEFIGK